MTGVFCGQSRAARSTGYPDYLAAANFGRLPDAPSVRTEGSTSPWASLLEALVSELEYRATADLKGNASRVGPQRELLEFSKRHLAQLRERKERLANAAGRGTVVQSWFYDL
jgi:hypothetical protein